MKKYILAALAATLLCVSAHAQDFNGSYDFVGKSSKGPGTSFANTNVTAFAISWTPSSTVLTCSVQGDSSADGSSWGSADLIASQNCATSGSVSATALGSGKNFVRITVTALTGNGSLNVNLKGYGSSSSGSSSPGSSWSFATTCGASSNCTTVQWDAHAVVDATTTNGSNIVTCPNADCNFTGTDYLGRPIAKVGQKFFAQDDTNDLAGAGTCYHSVNITFGGASTTTITSIDSATQIRVSGNANTSSTAKACIAWGDDDTATFIAGVNAAPCGANFKLPGGNITAAGATKILYSGAFFNLPIFQLGTNCAAIAASPAFLAPMITGDSVVGTYLFPTPDFTFASIVGGDTANASAKAAFGNFSMVQYKDFTIWGLGQQCSSMANTALFMAGSAARVYNVDGLGWCSAGGGATLSGFTFNGTLDTFEQGGGSYFGSIGLHVTSATGVPPGMFMKNNFFSGASVNVAGVGECLLKVDAGGSMYSENNWIVGCNHILGEMTSVHSRITSNNVGASTDGACAYVDTGTLNLLGGDRVCDSSRTNQAGVAFTNLAGTPQAGGQLSIFRAASMAGNGSGGILFGAAGSTIYDMGGNVWSPANAAAFWNGAGNYISDSRTVGGGCTGVATASQTLGLFGTGPNVTLTTCTSTTIGSGIELPVGRTFFNLSVTATAGGVNGSSGVVTVLKNGVATALTCTIGTATSCKDTTHTVAFAAGDLASIQFTTQAAETLAGVKAFVVEAQ